MLVSGRVDNPMFFIDLPHRFFQKTPEKQGKAAKTALFGGVWGGEFGRKPWLIHGGFRRVFEGLYGVYTP